VHALAFSTLAEPSSFHYIVSLFPNLFLDGKNVHAPRVPSTHVGALVDRSDKIYPCSCGRNCQVGYSAPETGDQAAPCKASREVQPTVNTVSAATDIIVQS